MLKKKMKVISLLILITIVLSMFTTCFADEENNVITSQKNSESTALEQQSTSHPETTLKKEDVYLAGDNITIDYIIDGNLFIVANTVTINSQIGGDAFICAKSIIIEENGYVFSNLFAISQKLEIKGIAYDVYSTSNETSVSGLVYRDLRTNCNTLNLSGTVGRNAFINCNTLNFPENSENSLKELITGDLNYTASKEVNIPEGIVKGNINFTESSELTTNTIQHKLASLITLIITVIIIWLICSFLAQKFNAYTHKLNIKKTLLSFALGFLTPIITLLLCAILLLLGFTSSIAILIFTILFILFAISTSISIIAINNILCDKIKLTKKLHQVGTLIAITTVLWLLSLIPILGTIIDILVVIFGLGIIITYFLDKHLLKKDKVTIKDL